MYLYYLCKAVHRSMHYTIKYLLFTDLILRFLDLIFVKCAFYINILKLSDFCIQKWSYSVNY